jgi:hypothetical protein
MSQAGSPSANTDRDHTSESPQSVFLNTPERLLRGRTRGEHVDARLIYRNTPMHIVVAASA